MGSFDIRFLKPAKEFIDNLDAKTREKILFNIWKTREINDPKLFKKLDKNIWEIRTRYRNKQFRLFAFWDKKDNQSLLLIATHGIIKKTRKIAVKETHKAEELRLQYFRNK